MAEAVGSARHLSGRAWTFDACRFLCARGMPRGTPREAQNDNAAASRGVAFPRNEDSESNYFETDFLNMRSIFSFVASQQAWLACAA